MENSEENELLKAAEEMKKAMEGCRTDEDSLINVATSHSNKERLKIKKIYKKKYNKDLIDSLKSELSGKLENAMTTLFKEPVEYDAECLYYSMKGIGTDEACLIEIIASRPNWLLQKIKVKYKELYKNELEEDIKGDTSGDFQRLLIGLLKCNRNTNKDVNKEECANIAKILSETKEEKWLNEGEEDTFYKYIILSSPQELSEVAKEYNKLNEETILDRIDQKFKGDTKDLIKTILYSLVSPSEYFAKRIKKAIDGFDNYNKTLIRILATRCEVDLDIIKKYYKQLYQKDMAEDIKSNIGGAYQKLVIDLIK